MKPIARANGNLLISDSISNTGEAKMPLQAVPRRLRITLFLLLCVLNIEEYTEAARMNGASGLCRRRCGAVEVPFPFGLEGDDPSCFYPDIKSFSLLCNSSFYPPKLFFDKVYEVIDISVANGRMRMLNDISYDCYDASGNNTYQLWNFHMTNVTQTLSYTDNMFTAIGCDTQAYIETLNTREFNYTGGCLSSCRSMEDIRDGDCSGFGCCQVSIAKNIRGYSTDMQSSNNHSDVFDFNPCGFSFLVEKGNYSFKASDLKGMPKTQQFPVVFDWFIGNDSCEAVTKSPSSYACVSNHSYCVNSTNGAGYICQCYPGYQGNPYDSDGCKDIDECLQPGSCDPGAVCYNTPGNYSCACPAGTMAVPNFSGCVSMPRKQTAVLGISLGISCGLGILLLSVGAAFMQKRIKKKRVQRQRGQYFKNNRDILLKQLLLCGENENAIDRITIFSLKDLEKATDKFDSSRIVGDGGHGSVYKGLLNLQVVAIKKSKVEIEMEKEQFINEVILLSQINHKNVVKLLGCCLESEVPLLVYEFVPNGTLANHLHVERHGNSLSWDHRLKIATEISSALAFMHTKSNISIYHRDIKSSNILLDDALTAKVSDFGASKTLSTDQTYVSTIVQGTFGYLDPEYMHTGRLTEKSDVYSLGVILVELITGLNPCSKKKLQDESTLVSHFSQAVENNILLQIVDPSLLEDANMVELESVANLAIACTHFRSIDRPTIKEVEWTLEGLMKGKKKIPKKTTMIMNTTDRPYSMNQQSTRSITINENTIVEGR